jgi:Fur family transcriptional regulator, ferric uptake regulator
MVTDEVHGAVAQRLAALGQRYTRNRRALVELLVAAGNPVSLPELLERDPSLRQSSTYRNLAVLEEAGGVRRLVTGAEHARFELAEDLTEHHHHLVCEACGAVTDFALADAVEDELDRALTAVAARAGFDPRHHSLDLVGVCAACR